MADITDSELTVIENVLNKTLDALSEDQSDVATSLKQEIAEGLQIVSSKQEQQGVDLGDTGPTGGAFPLGARMQPNGPPMMNQQDMPGADGPSMDLEEFKAIGMHLSEAMSIIQKVLGSTGIPKEAS